MNADVLQFFESHIDALPIYEALENAVLRDIQPVEVRVQKTQISFYNRRMFACASFLPARKKKDRPNRWTHHVPVQSRQQVDEQLLQWLNEAYQFAAGKR